MLNFEKTIKHAPVILTEGAIIERLKREFNVELDPNIVHAGMIYDHEHSKILQLIFTQYIDIAQKYDLPMMITTPTRRANEERISKTRYYDKDVNGDSIIFLKEIRKSYDEFSKHVYIGGLMGCKGNAYDAKEALAVDDAYNFHLQQAQSLAMAGADYLFAAVMPALTECIGMARAMSQTNFPYIISFVIRETGTLLDGTWLDEAIKRIDSSVDTPPICYMVNCIHPNVLNQALANPNLDTKFIMSRLFGIQANTSSKSPEELDGSSELFSDPEEVIIEGLINLRQQFGLKILGGCCGTDQRHIEGLARSIRQLK